LIKLELYRGKTIGTRFRAQGDGLVVFAGP